MIQAARAMPQGAPVFNLGGTTADMPEVVRAIEQAAPEMHGQITFEPTPLFTPEGVDGSSLEATIGPVDWRPLGDGVRQTMEHVRAADADGRIDLERAIA
jgi:hypothetical protein